MLTVIQKLLKYPRLTQKYPDGPIDTSHFIGSPVINQEQCNRCGACAARCPSQAISLDKGSNDIGINLDECIFCVLCEEACPIGAVTMSHRFELAEEDRGALRKGALIIRDEAVPSVPYQVMCDKLKAKIRHQFQRSLHIREVDSGSCNGCDYEINALNNPFNDVERLGISFVASPRHADLLLVTGTGTRNMQTALMKAYQATPDPKLVVAVGACACSGGIFKDTYATSNGIDQIVPVDVYIPGCPPRPQAILYGILKALDRIK